MNQTLEKIEKLGRIVAYNNSEDQILDITLNKILLREIHKIQAQLQGLKNEIFFFERKYALNSIEFIEQFKSGLLGDDVDFMEWASTIEMKNNAEEYILNLQGNKK
jgi:hypothetical protein